MHIAAVMAALEVDDLDHHAKMALVMVCCRANQHTAAATVSWSRLAADMKVHRTTAGRALRRVVNAGYLTVENRLGKTSRWRVDQSLSATRPVAQLATTPVAPGATTKDSMDTYKEGAHARNGKVNGLAFRADLPPNPWVFDDKTGAVRHR